MQARFFVATAMALLVAGCGGDSATPTPAPPPLPVPPPPPPPAATLYQSPRSFSVAVFDGLSVSVSPGRTIPIRVRFPANFVGAAGERLPVIVWSHGGGAMTDGQLNNVEWGNAFASAGYVVIHMSHLPRTTAQTNALYAEFGLTPQQGAQCFIPLLVDRPRDATAVLNDLARIQTLVPGLPAQFDLTRVAMAGHSFGAYTTRLMGGARVDLCPNAAAVPGFPANFAFRNVSFRSEVPRIFLALSPQGPDRFGFFTRSWDGLNRPDITLSGDGDITVPFGAEDEGEQPVDRVFPFSVMPAGDKFLMYIASAEATHNTFNLGGPNPVFNNYVRATGQAFMDTYMQNSATARNFLTANQLAIISNGIARTEAR